MLKRFLRWLTRARFYSDIGMWYMPAVDQIVPIVFGVIQQSIVKAMAVYFAIKLIASAIGYWDVKYGKRFQYSNEFSTKLNPYLVNLINGRGKDKKGVVR